MFDVQAQGRNGLLARASNWNSPRRWMLRGLGVLSSVLAAGLCTNQWLLALLPGLGVLGFGAATRYAETRIQASSGAPQRVWKILAFVLVFGAIAASPAFAVLCVAYGGETGRLIAALLLINAIISIILNSSIHGGARAAPAILPVVALLLLPIFPAGESTATAWMQIISIYLVAACLLASFYQTFLDQRAALLAARTATLDADARRCEAEEGRLQAETAARAKSDFMIMMSHEFRTPLNAVIGYGEILHEDLSAEGKQGAAQDAKRVCEAGHRLLDMVEQVLDLSAANEGESRCELAPTHFSELVEELALPALKQARANGNTFQFSLADGVEGGMADAGKIRQCLSNLLSNACKFTSAGSVGLHARYSDNGRAIEFVVSDTGIGILPEKLVDLFQPFHQVETGFSRTFDGAGLGLALTRRLARVMGGDVKVESAPGVGSIFTLSVPYLPLPASQPAAA